MDIINICSQYYRWFVCHVTMCITRLEFDHSQTSYEATERKTKNDWIILCGQFVFVASFGISFRCNTILIHLCCPFLHLSHITRYWSRQILSHSEQSFTIAQAGYRILQTVVQWSSGRLLRPRALLLKTESEADVERNKWKFGSRYTQN